MNPSRKESRHCHQRQNQIFLQELILKGFHSGSKNLETDPKHGRADKTQRLSSKPHSRSRKGILFLLEGLNPVEVCQLEKANWHQVGLRSNDAYLPAISAPSLGQRAKRSSISLPRPYRADRRRASNSSTLSQRTFLKNNQQEQHRGRREPRWSNVTVIMTYLGQRLAGASLDEMRVLQQTSGGGNVCVFMGHLRPGDPFQFISRRQCGYPFSVTLFVNGISVARISACCEYRHIPGFRQGRGSCFRLTALAGGEPCVRCAGIKKGDSLAQLSLEKKSEKSEGLVYSGERESCPSSPLFVPVRKDGPLLTARRRPSWVTNYGSTDSQDVDPGGECGHRGRRKTRRRHRAAPGSGSKEPSGRTKAGSRLFPKVQEVPAEVPAEKQRAEHLTKSHGREDESQTNDPLQKERVQSRQAKRHQKEQEENCKNRSYESPRESSEDCVGLKPVADSSPHKQTWLQTSVEERQHLVEKLFPQQCHDGDATSEVEFSEESDSGVQHRKRQPSLNSDQISNGSGDVTIPLGPSGGLPLENRSGLSEKDVAGRVQCEQHYLEGTDPPNHRERKQTSRPEGDPCPEGKLGATPVQEATENELDLQTQVDAMVTMLQSCDLVDQLILRNTGLTDDLLENVTIALKDSPSEVALINLNLNHIGPPGAQILLDLIREKPQIKGLLLFGNHLGDTGVCTLLRGLADLRVEHQNRTGGTQGYTGEVCCASICGTQGFTLLELDLGGNKVGNEGLTALAAYLSGPARLQYLGLAQTSGADMEAWAELFKSLETNSTLTHIILDENRLGDAGTELFAKMLTVNQSLIKVDLDCNNIGEDGGRAITEALTSRMQRPLEHLSLEGNCISTALMTKIHQKIRTELTVP